MIDKKRIVNDVLFESTLKQRLYDKVMNIMAFLKNDDAVAKEVLGKHSGQFLILLFRLASMYKVRYVKNELKLINNDIYFKFSNYVMYGAKEWPMSEEEKSATAKIIEMFIAAGVLKKVILEIDNDRKAVFYAADFYRIHNYLMYFYNNHRQLRLIDINKVKRKLIDGSIT